MHEEYIQVNDLAIESHLKQAFSAGDIEQFYKDFQADFQAYKDKNPDAYDILNSQIDFNKFKEQMIKFKKGALDTSGEAEG